MTKSAIRNMIALSKVLRKAKGHEDIKQNVKLSSLQKSKQFLKESKRLDKIESKIKEIKEKLGILDINVNKYSK